MVENTNQPKDKNQSENNLQPKDFETALAELESLTDRMAQGNLSLEESIAMYQRGVDLARSCQKTLDVAEQQVKVLQDQLLVPLKSGADQDNS